MRETTASAKKCKFDDASRKEDEARRIPLPGRAEKAWHCLMKLKRGKALAGCTAQAAMAAV